MGETLNSHQICNIEALSQEYVNESNEHAFGTFNRILGSRHSAFGNELNCASEIREIVAARDASRRMPVEIGDTSKELRPFPANACRGWPSVSIKSFAFLPRTTYLDGRESL